ncbi:PIR Superfamily Protein [Plasmodium ovale wallikeri]|uniref:PIR Superfamily Protein n=1 Tax=Plasmodium ovale wallikeri TaxID=864142 RepID=A0A1A9ASS1_PLAOA|nr:PIR Superfamily Protein [Plasmodium ovale wallikeri]
MTRTKVTEKGIYDFCRNSPYYQMVVENINREIDVQEEVDVKKKDDIQKIKDACNSFSYNVCSLDSTTGKDICTNFFCMYRFLNEAYRKQYPNSILTYEDFDFLNYWLNSKLNGGNGDALVCISKFENEIGNKFDFFNTSKTKLEKHLHVVESGNLENMKLLYELYSTKQKIFDIMLKEDQSNNQEALCPQYLKKCYDDYKQGMNNCLNDYDDFYKALKKFKYYYKYGIEKETDKSGYCNISDDVRLPEYDPVLERKQKKIMLIQNITTPLIMLFIIPLFYKFTPFGSFLREKIRMVKDKWVSQDKNGEELLSLSTYIEDNNSDNEEYNISYYSETNY